MKNKFTLLTAFFLISFMAANAQFTTGKYLLGGEIDFRTESEKDSDAKNENANVNLKLGKVIKENTVVGINLSYGYFSFDNQSSQKQESNQYGAGIFYRKYKTLSKDFHLFGEAGLNYVHGESKNTYTNNSGNKIIKNGATLNFIPGLSYSFTKKMQLELLMPNLIGIGFSNEKTKNILPGGLDQPEIRKNTFSFLTNANGNVIFNFGVGFKFILGK